MAGATSLQRSAGGSVPRTDVHLAKDAWDFIRGKRQAFLQQEPSVSEGDMACSKMTSQESVLSKANTIVVSSDKGAEKEENEFQSGLITYEKIEQDVQMIRLPNSTEEWQEKT
ncbi:hypothetical protein N7509_004330 [Penicillium cosmopolitanum]|uniref:Uncharacterized protein n=1 Tax=Penicillium cosmopolitanum TaxID=1131564 RepID=A0A9X0BCB7_9EURO|nr:uncharacterized protein N7509_004330 [Penicillium cosmopolitanum]KAJ5404459.1 hypothetical protein N7509_004330 [Penicillium cosmopolitanum]